MEKILDKYQIIADRVPAKITIYEQKEDSVPIYKIELPQIGETTKLMLDQFMEDLSDKVPVDIEGVVDPKKVMEIKENLYQETRKYLQTKLTNLSKEKLDILAGMILHKMYGLDFIEVILSDDYLEELAINGPNQPIAVYHKKFGWCKTTQEIGNQENIYTLSSQIGRKIGTEINLLNPIMDAHLLSGDRVSSTLFPISTEGNTITIRRFSRNPWTPVGLIKQGTMNAEIVAFLWIAIQYELNIIIAGGTASGKTSVLNALCAFLPSTQRIISIEDTREISLPQNLKWNWVPLTSRNQNPEGKGEITMLDLMIASLRMRPDRIVVGEVRKRDQAETLFEAMHTGHSVYATMHADTVQQLKRRLIEPPISIPKTELEALHLGVVQVRDRIKGKRRTLEVAEILSGGKNELELNTIFRYRARTDTFENISTSTRIFEELNLHTGMTNQEILDDLDEKQKILTKMVDENIENINDFGVLMHIYYSDKEKILNTLNSNKKFKELLK